MSGLNFYLYHQYTEKRLGEFTAALRCLYLLFCYVRRLYKHIVPHFSNCIYENPLKPAHIYSIYTGRQNLGNSRVCTRLKLIKMQFCFGVENVLMLHVPSRFYFMIEN